MGAIGDNLRMDYTAVGDTTHLAARLQQIAKPGTIVISDTTAQLVGGYAQLEPRGPVEMRGRSAPMSVYLVVGRGEPRSPLEARDERSLSQFVGRTREIGALRGLSTQVEAGQRTGGRASSANPGSASRGCSSSSGTRWPAGRSGISRGVACPSAARSRSCPCWTWCARPARLPTRIRPEAAIEKVRAALTEIGLDPATSMPFVLHLLGLKDSSEPAAGRLSGLGPEAIKTRTFDTLRQMVLRDSQRRPLVIALEDLHWIDRTSEEFLASLVESLAGAAIMLLTTYRPGYRPAWLDKSYTTQLVARRA